VKKSGVLLHISSLPNDEGIGTLGPEAHEFVDLLARSGQAVWQVLPVHPTIIGDSPFQGPSVFAGNPNLISLRALVGSGDLLEEERDEFVRDWCAFKDAHSGRSDTDVEYGYVWEAKLGFDSFRSDYERAPLRRAYERFRCEATPERREDFERFREENAEWLRDYALFMAIKESYGFSILWCEWQEAERFRQSGFDDSVDLHARGFYEYVQFVFEEQMTALCVHARSRGVELIGDLAVYPGYDSADVWANRDLFQLDADGEMTHVAAVPPDYFSADGQLWGNPLYAWGDESKSEALYEWWAKRMRREMCFFSRIKIDHFRGFESYGRVPADAETAREAKWTPGPGKPLFDYLERELEGLPIIAEDLGIITDDVRALLGSVGCPGMRVFIFVNWDEYDCCEPPESNPHAYLPHNADGDPNSVFYTGTHDNETLRQKIEDVCPEAERKAMLTYLDRSSEEGVNWRAIDLISASGSDLVIFPAQDVLYLGAEARMNNPSDDHGWWKWRLTPQQMDSLEGECAERLRAVALRHGRASY
jgi:4-alpha-glucanotransferase